MGLGCNQPPRASGWFDMLDIERGIRCPPLRRSGDTKLKTLPPVMRSILLSRAWVSWCLDASDWVSEPLRQCPCNSVADLHKRAATAQNGTRWRTTPGSQPTKSSFCLVPALLSVACTRGVG